MKIKSIDLSDAYGRQVKVLQKREVTTTLGGKHGILSFEVPVGYLRPNKIVYMEGVEPVYTDNFIMMNPAHPLVKAPAIDGLESACRLNLRQASHAVVLGGRQLSSWIDWENPLKMQQDRGWFRVLNKRPVEFYQALLGTGVMVRVPGELHHPHKPNFELVGSFKTKNRVPVFQVTIWQDAGEWVAELDIDLKKGVGHWREVIGNHLTERKTHPYIVNQLLAWYWGVISFKLVVSRAGDEV